MSETTIPDSAPARGSILSKLRAAPAGRVTAPAEHVPTPPGTERGIDRFRELMTTNRAEIIDTTDADWPQAVMAWLTERGFAKVLYAPDTEAGRRLSNSGDAREGEPSLIPYDGDIEAMKPVLVREVDAAITETRAAIAATGSVVLWPTRAEPRLMSLLPPVHIALVRASALRPTLGELIREQGWAAGMPTNVVLVSGPSKTADIAQVLAFGVHGPKELLVVLIADA